MRSASGAPVDEREMMITSARGGFSEWNEVLTPRTEAKMRSASGAPVDEREMMITSARGRTIFVAAALLAVSVGAYAQRLPAGRKVSGVVIDASTRRPVPNANVVYEERGQPDQTTLTDAKGAFEFRADCVAW